MTEATLQSDSDTKNPVGGVRRIISAIGLLRESPAGLVGALLVTFWVLVAIFAPLISPYEPNATLVPYMKPGAVNPDGGTFWLGTDHIGRDILITHHWRPFVRTYWVS